MSAERTAQDIIRRIKNTYLALFEDVYRQQSGVTSDDLSQAMVRFLPEIERLANDVSYDNCYALAYRVMLVLKVSSYASLEGGARGYGCRPSDKPADDLLEYIINARVVTGDRWSMRDDLNELEREAITLMAYNIEPWFPKTRETLRCMMVALM